MEKITVVGSGYVGLVSGTCFADIGNRVICCDVDPFKIAMLRKGEIPIYEPGLKELVEKNIEAERLFFTSEIGDAIEASDIIYIAVGTPMGESGEADMRYVHEVARTIGQHLNRYKIIVNKSTVPVGTGRAVEQIIKENRKNRFVKFDVVSNPEFLREGSAIEDCMNMERAVIGATSDEAAKRIAELHAPFRTRIFQTNLESAEMIKYAANAFLATKISFINGIANVCERVGADVTAVSAGMGLDSRIGGKFLQAGIGYGGSCFPKDTFALSYIAEEAGFDFNLLKSVITANDEQRFVVVNKLREALGSLQGKRIGVLGLSFKPNTDDMRYAPSLTIIPELVNQGASVRAFDPIARQAARNQIAEYYEDFGSIEETLEDCDACLILTEWSEIVEMDLTRVKELLKAPVMVDGRNCFTTQKMADEGFNYYSVGRPAVTVGSIHAVESQTLSL
ncbi:MULTISPECIES: UDP-glucose 6-dehydrogenase TuaD [Paenibacillus]|uniref:UDP-glucose 6-dehydrogenase n=1 Tax=Paenibacillus lutrae TaxID=2078573 RepID=A0A7X3FIM6_9BACL|nr:MULTISPECIES: UDP-glucose/GDP-mannose dehydrogenase family protein [Paenibacillus]MVP00481.1 nucleotide sugar dehydrogenase [Paenibacillus lutrae]